VSDVIDQLRGLGFCASREQLEALLTHATANRLSHVQVVELLVEMERRQREARNLVTRTRTIPLRRPPVQSQRCEQSPKVKKRANQREAFFRRVRIWVMFRACLRAFRHDARAGHGRPVAEAVVDRRHVRVDRGPGAVGFLTDASSSGR
jgi:hypothetical protein